MKTKFSWLALLASAAMIAQANAGGHHGGGGGGAGNVIATPASSRGGGISHVGPVPTRGFNGGRIIYYSGQRFSPVGPQRSGMFHPYYMNTNGRTDRFEAGTMNRAHDPRLANSGVRTARNARSVSGSQLRNEHLPAGWRNHVLAQHSANWHRDWDRRSDHWWHGHRCHFFNGSWIVFDLGFYPWGPYWYPYDYYGYDYYSYPYGYAPGYYGSDVYEPEQYYDQNNYDVTVQNADSIVGNAQEKLAQQGYYDGGIDGILGAETRRAIARFQSDQGLRVTGVLTRDTLSALELRQVALY